MTDCQWFDPVCKTKAAVGSALTDATGQALQQIADGTSAAVGKVFGALGSLWVVTPTPTLTGSHQATSEALPSGLTILLGYVQWIGLGVAGLALIVLAVLLVQRDHAEQTKARFSQIVVGVLVIGGASSIIAHLVGGVGEQSSSTVAFLRGELMSFTMWAAVLGTLIAAIRLIVSNAKASLDWFKGMLTLMIVAGGSAAIAQGIVTALDAVSIKIINDSLSCDDGGNSCFGTSLSTMIGTAAQASTAVTGGAAGALILVIFLGIIAIATSLMQVMFMLIRGGMLVALVGGMPLAASAAMAGEAGRQWWQRYMAWFLAFAMYKPVAAIIYATGFKLVGELSTDDSSGIVSAASGLALLATALVALPALMRFWAPVTAAVASGGGGGAGAVAAAGGVAQGAAQIASASRSGADAPTGSAVAKSSSGGSAGGGEAAASRGAASGASGGAAAGGASGGAAAGGASGGAAAGGASGAAAAGGPVGLAVGAGVQVVDGAAKAVAKGANNAAGGAE